MSAPALPCWEHVYSGKVRDLYRPAGEHPDGDVVLVVASDRISAYDHVLPTPIPGKGEVLTRLSLWWFDQLADIVPNHLVSTDVPAQVAGRAMVCRRLEMFPVECVARGYLTGSGMTEYRQTQAVCGVPLPPGLVEAARLPEPIFTPARKAEVGDHDENITFAAVAEMLGQERAAELRDLTLAVYARAAEVAARSGIIVADTKLEFGLGADGTVVLGDEVLTPDSSRFWPTDGYTPGRVQPSFDKQFVRDYLETLTWDKRPPGPKLPEEVVRKTAEKYAEAERRLIT